MESDLGVSVMSAMDPAMMDGSDRDRMTEAKIYTRISSKAARNELISINDFNYILYSSRKLYSCLRENTQLMCLRLLCK